MANEVKKQCMSCTMFNEKDGFCRRTHNYVNALAEGCDEFTSEALPKKADPKPETERTCRRCGRTLPIENFHRANNGRVHTCNDCIRELQRVHHAGGRAKGTPNKATAGKPGPKRGAKYKKKAGSAEQVQGPSRDQVGPKPALHLFEPRDLSSWTIADLFAELDRLNAEISITISRIRK